MSRLHVENTRNQYKESALDQAKLLENLAHSMRTSIKSGKFDSGATSRAVHAALKLDKLIDKLLDYETILARMNYEARQAVQAKPAA